MTEDTSTEKRELSKIFFGHSSGEHNTTRTTLTEKVSDNALKNGGWCELDHYVRGYEGKPGRKTGVIYINLDNATAIKFVTETVEVNEDAE